METFVIDKEKKKLIENISKGIIQDPRDIQFSLSEDEQSLKCYLKNWYMRIFDFNINEYFSPTALEYIFHGPNNIQVIKPGGTKIESSDYTQEDFELALSILCLRNSISWNQLNPFVSFNAKIQGQPFRVTLTHSSLSNLHNSKLYLRPLNTTSFSLESFTDQVQLITNLIKNKDNILIAGATGSGKTSFLNSLLKQTCSDEHLVILEDTQELMSPHDKTTRFISQNQKSYRLTDYMTYAMRMSPKRIIIGELRSKEVESFLLALNTGHSGCISSIHANNAKDAIHRLALLYQIYSESKLSYNIILDLIAKSIDKIIFLKDRKVVEVIRLVGADQNDVFFEKLM